MKLYLVRHAHAVDGADDDARELSAKGRQQVRAMGAFLRENQGLATHEFWHSPAVRAEDTAARFAARLKIRAKLVEVAGLRWGDDPAVIARRLKTLRRPVALFGHEPHLGRLASLLVGGRAEPVIFTIPKGAVVCLERTSRRWTVCWQVTPELL